MDIVEQSPQPYVVPRYTEAGDPAWYHVLHGTVPGHQIDFMYCPDIPQGRLTQTHVAHLGRLLKYIEPRQNAPYAFALGNLSRDDVQHEPGHGGLALIFALRVAGVTDHAGRAMPPYAHGVLAIDRALDQATLLEAISVFYRRFLEPGTETQVATGGFYRSYVRAMQQRPESVERFLRDYVADFRELPQPAPSQLDWEWEVDEATLPKRITIVHADDEAFSSVARAAAVLGAMLYKSNVKWTAITNGRIIEIPGGLSIRFVPESEAPRGDRDLVLSLEDLPEDEATIAQKLFGARSRTAEVHTMYRSWREALSGVDPAAPEVVSGNAAAVPAPHEEAPSSDNRSLPLSFAGELDKAVPPAVSSTVKPASAASEDGPAAVAPDRGAARKAWMGMWIGIAGAVAVVVAVVAAIAGGGAQGQLLAAGPPANASMRPAASPPAPAAQTALEAFTAPPARSVPQQSESSPPATDRPMGSAKPMATAVQPPASGGPIVPAATNGRHKPPPPKGPASSTATSPTPPRVGGLGGEFQPQTPEQ